MHAPLHTITTRNDSVGRGSCSSITAIVDGRHFEEEDPSSSSSVGIDRRTIFQRTTTTAAAVLLSSGMMIGSSPTAANAASFTAGGSLVDRDVGPQVGNAEASASRKFDNSNVLFDKDHYFKFGVGAPWIEPGTTDFPKTMPFTPSQQRYDALKKYKARVTSGVQYLAGLEGAVKDGKSDFAAIVPDPATTPEYQLRPMGLLANSFLASENTGATNELFLARWYINEIYLQMGDVRAASTPADALKAYANAKKAINSYLGMLNRVINAKVGDPFDLLPQ